MFKSSAKPHDSSDDGTGTFPETGSLVVASRGSSSRLFDLRPHEVIPERARDTLKDREPALHREQGERKVVHSEDACWTKGQRSGSARKRLRVAAETSNEGEPVATWRRGLFGSRAGATGRYGGIRNSNISWETAQGLISTSCKVEVRPSTACLTALPRAAAWDVEQLLEPLTLHSLAAPRASYAVSYALHGAALG